MFDCLWESLAVLWPMPEQITPLAWDRWRVNHYQRIRNVCLRKCRSEKRPTAISGQQISELFALGWKCKQPLQTVVRWVSGKTACEESWARPLIFPPYFKSHENTGETKNMWLPVYKTQNYLMFSWNVRGIEFCHHSLHKFVFFFYRDKLGPLFWSRSAREAWMFSQNNLY